MLKSEPRSYILISPLRPDTRSLANRRVDRRYPDLLSALGVRNPIAPCRGKEADVRSRHRSSSQITRHQRLCQVFVTGLWILFTGAVFASSSVPSACRFPFPPCKNRQAFASFASFNIPRALSCFLSSPLCEVVIFNFFLPAVSSYARATESIPVSFPSCFSRSRAHPQIHI